MGLMAKGRRHLKRTLKRVWAKAAREVKKQLRQREAKRLGITAVAPNYLYFAAPLKGGVVVDAGCGYAADLSLHMIAAHGARAFAVDPTHKHAPALKALADAHPGRLTHLPYAIGAADGSLTFHESAQNESGSLLNDHVNVARGDQVRRYEVKVVTPLSLVRELGVEQVAFLKLDIEGAEYELLMSLTAEQLKPFLQVFIEFHHHAIPRFEEADTRVAVRRLEGMGFKSFSLDDHNVLFWRP